ncbi:MAG: TonB-dependent receptor [Steroidobacteraceae bacterium]
MRTTDKALLVAAAVSAMIHGTTTVAADAPPKDGQNDAQLDEIVVTSNYRGEELQKVGASIGVLRAEELENRGVTEFIDISRNVPGLNVIDAGPGQKTVFIRGLVGAGESTVGLYYDGMPTTGSGESAAAAAGRQTDLYVYDAERVEVLRGPQSTLYGSSALAGVVRILTNQPKLSKSEQEIVLDGSSTAHGDNNYALKAMLNMPLIDDRLAVRLVGYKAHDGGFIDNSYLHLKDINDVDQLGMRLGAKWAVSDHGTLSGQFFAQKMDAGDQAIERPYSRVVGTTSVPAAGALTNDAHARQPRSDETKMGGLNYVHDFGNYNLTLAHSVFRRDNTDDQDLAGLPYFFAFLQSINEFPPVPVIPNGVFESRQKTDMNTSEARLVTNLDGPWNGVVGLLYQDRTVEIWNSFLQTNATNGLIEPGIAPWYSRTADFTLKQAAAYGELSYAFSPKLTATAGLRTFHNKRTDHAHGIVGFMRLGGATPVTTLTASESKTIFKGALNYKFTDSLMGYVSASQGYRAGGTVNQVVPELPPAFGPDYTWNFETGFKSEWLDRRLQLNMAAYRVNWYDMQYSGDFFNGAFSGVLNCQGKCAHSNGVEMELTARPMPGLDINLASTLMKAELNKTLTEANGSPVSGTQLTNTPKFTLAGSVNYGWDIGAGARASLHADLQHTGRVANMSYRTSLNLPGPAYTLFNASASLNFDHWDVRLYGRNLGNKRAQVTTQNDTVTPAWVYVNRPRTVGLEVTFKSL